MPYSRLVVGTDGSETAVRAVRHASQLAVTARASLVVVGAARSRSDVVGADAAVHAAAELAERAGVRAVQRVTRVGLPARVLVEVASENGADLLVVGSRAMTDESRFVLGSVANQVTHLAGCDVLIAATT